MNPWTIIGWVVMAFFCVVALYFVGLVASALLVRCRLRWRHYATRNTPPAVGQVWIDRNGERYPIVLVDNGIGFKEKTYCGSISFGWPKDHWVRNVRGLRMWLLSTDGGEP